MSRTIINLIVDNFLSEIMEIDLDNTKSSIFSGNVELQGIKIKNSIFEKVNIPYFDLVYGFIGKLNIKFSINIWSNPIKIEISDIFILVKQKPLDELNETDEIKKMEKYKKGKLLSIEQLIAGVKEGKPNEPSKGGFINNIINNLQIEIKNFVFRFEDSVSYPTLPFSFGIINKKFCIKSSNQFFEDSENFIQYSDVNYKMASIQGVNVFMDYQKTADQISYKHHILDKERIDNGEKKTFLGNDYDFYCYSMSEIKTFFKDEKYHYYLLYNWTANLNATINEVSKINMLPKLKLQFIISHLQMNFGINHITIFSKLLAYITLNLLYLKGIKRKFYNKNLTYDEKNLYVETYAQYFIDKYERKKEPLELMRTLEKIEEGLNYEQIAILRTAANSGIETLKMGKLIEEMEKEIESRQKKGYVGSLFSYFKSSGGSVEELNKKKQEMLIQNEKKQKKIQEQLSKEYAALPEESDITELGHQYMVYDFTFNIKYTKITLSEDKSINLIIFYFKEFILQTRMGDKWYLFNIYLEEISANQYKTNNKYFTKLIESVIEEDHENPILQNPKIFLKNSITSILDNSAYSKNCALNIHFEINPELEKSNYSLKISNNKRLLICLNFYTIYYTLYKIYNAVQGEFQFSLISNLARQEVAQFIEDGYQMMLNVIKGEYQHLNMEVDITFNAPKFIIPFNIDDPSNGSCLSIDMGLLETKSNLAVKKDKNINYHLTDNIGLVYDIYKLNLTGLELSTIENYLAFKTQKDDTSLKIIKNVNIKIDFNNSIEPKNENFENFRVKLFIGDFNINIRDVQIVFIIYFYNNFNSSYAKLNKELSLEIKKSEKVTLKLDQSSFIANNDQLFMKTGNFIRNYRKTLKKRKVVKDKKFASIDFILTKFGLTIFKSISEEENKIQKGKNLNDIILFKEFLRFNANSIKFSFSLTERRNIRIESTITNVSFLDCDYNIQLNRINEEEKNFFVNKKFRCIMGSINEEVEEKESVSCGSVYSEACDYLVIESNKKSFISLSIFINLQKMKSKIEFSLSKFSICNNFDTLLRILQFGIFYLELFGNVTRKTNDLIKKNMKINRKHNSSISVNSENMEHLQLSSRNIIIADNNPNDENVNNASSKLNDEFMKVNENNKKAKEVSTNKCQGRKKFIGRLLEKVHNRKLNKAKSNEIIIQNNYTDIIQPHHNDIIVLKQNVEKEFFTNTIKLSFEMTEIELMFPLDHNQPNTKVLKFNYNIMLKMNTCFESECLYDEDKLVKQDYTKRNIEANLMIFNTDFDIINYVENELIYRSLLSEKLICNSRFNLGFRTFLNLAKETTVFVLDLHVEPITFAVGFREIKIFEKFTFKAINVGEQFGKSLENYKSSIKNLYKSKLMVQISEMNEEIIQKYLYNTKNFNNLIEINFKIDKSKIKLIDNTSFYEIPMAKYEVSKIFFKFILNTDPVDAHNMGIELVEMISGHQDTNYNFNNMYYYLNACFHIEILFFNQRVFEWEPIMEPWNAELNLYQVAKMTRLKIAMNSDIMLNINLTHHMMVIFNNIMKKFKQCEIDWQDENKNISALQAKLKKSGSDIVIEFKNFTGISVEFWFDSNPEKKIEIINGRCLEMTKAQLDEIHEKIDYDITVFTKDKFSFKLLGYDIIKNVDISLNRILIFPVNGESQYFEICVKIEKNSQVRSISFESNIYILNNTEFSIGLSILNSKELLNKSSCVDGDNPLQNFENTEYEKLDKDKIKKVQVNWLTQPHIIFGKIIHNDLNFSKMLFSDLNFIYSIGSNLKENDDKRLLESYSKLINYSKNGKIVILSIDILVLKSNLEECKCYFYYIIINPHLIFKNSIPYPIVVINNEKKKNFIPLRESKQYEIDLNENTLNKLRLGLNYFNDLYLESRDFTPNELLKQKLMYVKLYFIDEMANQTYNSTKDYLVCNIKLENLDYIKFINLTFFKCEMFISKSYMMIFYSDFLVTNRINQKVEIKPINMKENQPINLLNSVLHSKKVNLFSLENPKETKVKIKFDDTNWSKSFDITTNGLEGVVHLNHFKDEDNIKRNETSVASIITSSSIFNHSTIIILEPRFFLLNKMPFDAFFRQTSRQKPYHSNISKLSSQESIMISLKCFKIKDIKKLIQFSLSDDEENSDKNIWSSEIDVDSLDDFTIKLKVPPLFDIQKYNINKQNLLTINTKLFILAKLIIYTKDNGLIYMILHLPKCSQYIIRNKSTSAFSINQLNNNEEILVPANSETPYSWADCTAIKKRLMVKLKNKEVKIAFEKLEQQKFIQTDEERINFSILLENNNQTRILNICSDEKNGDREKNKNNYNISKKINKITKVNVNLYGFGISIIDSTPKELIYISFYKIDISLTNNNIVKNNMLEKVFNIILLVKNFQVDYCLMDSFNCMIAPDKQIKPLEEEQMAEEVTPFIQILVTFKIIDNLFLNTTSFKFSQIDFSMQQMNIKIDQEIINNLFTLITSVINVVDFTQYKSNFINVWLDNEQTRLPYEYDEILSVEIEKIYDLNKASDEYNMIFIENLMVSGMKFKITLRIDIESLNLQLIPTFFLKILSTIGNSFGRISDAPVNFKEYIIQNCFTDGFKLAKLLIKNFTIQGVAQFYRILGSSDLLGNPIGLLHSVGTGFVEFFNEPRKGFMQGPKKFGEGLAKGLASLVGNVVGGSLNVVSNITGTLYSAVKNVGGDKVLVKEDDEPGNIISGTYQGIKGGGMELYKGITGIFTNPYKRGKREGATGFIKGIGTGLLGAILSPFAAAMKLGNAIIIGLKNTMTFFHKGKVKTDRFRHPRHINKSEPLNPYDENYAEVQEIIRIYLDKSDKKIIFFIDFLYEDDMKLYNEMPSTLIITDHRVILCYGVKSLLLSIELNDMSNCEVHFCQNIWGKYLLVFFLKNNEKKFIPTRNLSMCCQVYSILKKLIK